MPPSEALVLDEELVDDLLYSARAGDLELFASLLSEPPKDFTPIQLLFAAKDPQSANTPVHYAAANGHTKILEEIISCMKRNGQSVSEGLSLQNAAGNTALHYAALNGQLASAKLLVSSISESGSARMDYLQKKNEAGHDAAFEAEIAGKDDVVNWLLEHMDALEPVGEVAESASNGDGDEEMPVENGHVDLAEDQKDASNTSSTNGS